MAASQQGQYFTYRARNNKTGLTDVKANVYVGATAKFVGSSAIALTEIDATNSPGMYQGYLTPAQMTSLGASTSGKLNLILYINSASASLADQMRLEVTVTTSDDIYNLLGTPTAASMSADIANLTAQVLTIQTGLTSMANAAASGVSRVVGLDAVIPASGSFGLKVPVTIRNLDGIPIAPTSITVTMQNTSGVDRGMYITGATSTGGAAYTLSPTATSTGLYYIPIAIPSTYPSEEAVVLTAAYSYVDNGQTISDTAFGVIEIATDINAAGLSTAASVAAVNTLATNILAKLNDATVGLANIESNAAAANTQSAQAVTIGQSNATSIGTANTALTSIQGSGFTSSANSLVALTAAIQQTYAYMQANVVTGGKAV